MAQVEDLKSVEFVETRLNDTGHGENQGIRFWRQDKTALILTAIMLLCLFSMLSLLALLMLAVMQSVLGITVPLAGDSVQWLGRGSKGLYLAVGLAVTGLVSYLLLRYVVPKRALLYADTGCPQCQEHDLVRVRRGRRDRAAAYYLGISTMRYACRNCSWVGVRIGGPFPTANSNQKTLAADMILLNDLGTQQSEPATNENN